MQGLVDALSLLQGELVFLHKLVDVEPVSPGGWDASGGGVGLFQKAHCLQVGHFVADGGGRDIQIQTGCDGLGAHGLRSLDVTFDDGAENAPLSASQLHEGRSFSSCFDLALHILEC